MADAGTLIDNTPEYREAAWADLYKTFINDIANSGTYHEAQQKASAYGTQLDAFRDSGINVDNDLAYIYNNLTPTMLQGISLKVPDTAPVPQMSVDSDLVSRLTAQLAANNIFKDSSSYSFTKEPQYTFKVFIGDKPVDTSAVSFEFKNNLAQQTTSTTTTQDSISKWLDKLNNLSDALLTVPNPGSIGAGEILKAGTIGAKGLLKAGKFLSQAEKAADVVRDAKVIARPVGEVVKEAQMIQKTAGYAVDEFATTSLQKGAKVYGLVPGQSAWYTNIEALESSGGSYKKMYEGLQIAPHEVRGYRKELAVYEVVEDITVASGQALANKTINTSQGIKYLGEGGFTQYVIPDQTKLKLVKIIKLDE